MDIVEKELRPIKPWEAKVKVEYSGLCHTDLHVAAGDFGAVPGRVIGHEGVGRVVELGSHDELVTRGGQYASLWETWQRS